MRRKIFAGLMMAGLAFSMLPAHADFDACDRVGNGACTIDPRSTDALHAINRIPPGAAGEHRHVTLIYGPYVIPPGQDMNRITLDVPLQTGFYTSVFPNLIDVRTGKEPTEQEAHIHHAHWFRVTSGSQYEYYTPINGADGLSWVFGTGEERTGGSLVDRESPPSVGGNEPWSYGIFLDGSTPQALIFMIHNKSLSAMPAYITLNIDMIYGSRDEIKAATGRDIHPLRGVLTGTTQNAMANQIVDGNSINGVLMQDYTADFSGKLIASASHMHPGGKWVDVLNLGPRVNGKFVCGNTTNGNAVTDVDGDGLPGTTLFVSKKVDHDMNTWPYSEDYQMGGTQGGFRAPIHKGDVIRQYGVYDVARSGDSLGGLPTALFRSDPLDLNSPLQIGSLDNNSHAWYQAMSYTGLYSDDDPAAQPALATGITSASQCTSANFAPTIVPTNGNFSWPNPIETRITHGWLHTDPVCGQNVADKSRGYLVAPTPCEDKAPLTYVNDPTGQLTSTINTANFTYVPGDLNTRDLNNNVIVPLVKRGTTLRLVNEDIGTVVRHTFTSCDTPCEGSYVANYPTPNGLFESGKLGNLDYIDGGLWNGAPLFNDLGGGHPENIPNTVFDPRYDTLPYKDIAIDGSYQVGQIYHYYCTIHPTMRGVFKVV